MLESESDVKKRVSDLLDSWKPHVYYEMHVPYGYGKSGLDYNGCAQGRALFIETKAPGKYPTGRQRLALVAAFKAGGTCFIVTNEDGIAALDNWLWRTMK